MYLNAKKYTTRYTNGNQVESQSILSKFLSKVNEKSTFSKITNVLIKIGEKYKNNDIIINLFPKGNNTHTIRNDDKTLFYVFLKIEAERKGITIIKLLKDNNIFGNKSIENQEKLKELLYGIFNYISGKYKELYGELEKNTERDFDNFMEETGTYIGLSHLTLFSLLHFFSKLGNQKNDLFEKFDYLHDIW